MLIHEQYISHLVSTPDVLCREALIVTTPEITSIRDAGVDWCGEEVKDPAYSVLPFSPPDRVAGLLEANGVFNVKLLVNRVRPEMIKVRVQEFTVTCHPDM